MDTNRISTVYNWMKSVGNQPNCTLIFFSQSVITNVRNDLICISSDIEKDYPFFSKELFEMKDQLFYGVGYFNPFIFGRIIEILKTLLDISASKSGDIWNYIHPAIVQSSKALYLDGHYSNAAENAFIEINARVKRLFAAVRPGEKQPDGSAAMTTVFSNNKPLVEFCDRTSETGKNIQKGYMEMLSGAISALRNPKAHSNDVILTADEAMRRLMFASMLMYKIDEAVEYSHIAE